MVAPAHRDAEFWNLERITARRAEAQAIVTRMGQDRASGLGSPQGRLGGEPSGAGRKRRIERGADKACAPKRLRVNRPVPIRENLERERRTRIDPQPGVAQAGNGRVARTLGMLRRRRGMRRAVAAPPVPCWQRGTASTEPRGRARRSRAPWRPLTRLWRRTTRTAAARRMKLPRVASTRIMHMRRAERRFRGRGPAALGRMRLGLPGRKARSRDPASRGPGAQGAKASRRLRGRRWCAAGEGVALLARQKKTVCKVLTNKRFTKKVLLPPYEFTAANPLSPLPTAAVKLLSKIVYLSVLYGRFSFVWPTTRHLPEPRTSAAP